MEFFLNNTDDTKKTMSIYFQLFTHNKLMKDFKEVEELETEPFNGLLVADQKEIKEPIYMQKGFFF